MCKGAVAAPRPLQALVYPILRRMSLPFCENSRKFLKLCTAVRKNETFEKGKNYSLSQNLTVLPAPPKGGALRDVHKSDPSCKSSPFGGAGERTRAGEGLCAERIT